MTSVTALAGWILAGVAAALLVAGRRMLEGRMEAVARACHELRGPLAAVRLGLSFGSRTGELSAGRLRAIDTELGRAALALDDLAAVRAAGRRRGQPRLGEIAAVDVRALVVDSVEAWTASAAAAGVTLSTGRMESGGTVWGDRLRLAQAVGNLLANAIEHGGGWVQARVVGPGDLVRVEVIDDGAGLPAPVAELIRRGRHARGSRGRGLAIASGVAVAHGGRVAAAPATRGARLVLELPRAARSAGGR